ncbi:Hypothetical protein PBC10988_15250 [Planctomycetales bacterium 10988]|nr:Hypothetical protein PBC10988_15250 [Planctomycetales bacterium 10988]
MKLSQQVVEPPSKQRADGTTNRSAGQGAAVLESGNLETFITNLETSRLISSNHVGQLRSRIVSHQSISPETMSQLLVEGGILNGWQAKELLAGRTRFFYSKPGASGNRYKLLDRLGAGGSGTVYKAFEEKGQREVALKVLDSSLLSKGDMLTRFQREARVALALHHPNMVTAYEAALEGDSPFLVMELVDGKDLFHWWRDHGPLPISWACECIRQVALALQYGHQRGLVHRDVKPSNIVILGDLESCPRAKILDLGFARMINDKVDEERLTRPDQTFGTPDYIAPEQAESTRNADTRSDIFSLGCTLFKVLTGEIPYEGKTKLQKIMARASREARSIRELRADVPEELDAVLRKMMARLPENRYQEPGEVAEAIAPFAWEANQGSATAMPASEREEILGRLGTPTRKSSTLRRGTYRSREGDSSRNAAATNEITPPSTRRIRGSRSGMVLDVGDTGATKIQERNEELEAKEAESTPTPEDESISLSASNQVSIAPANSAASLEAMRRVSQTEAQVADERNQIRRKIALGMFLGGIIGGLIGTLIGLGVGWLSLRMMEGNYYGPGVIIGFLIGAAFGAAYQGIMTGCMAVYEVNRQAHKRLLRAKK